MEEQERRIPKKWLIVGTIALVLLLAAGAFMGGMWMIGQATGMGDLSDVEAFNIKLVAHEETPDDPPEMAGAVKRVDDNSIFVSTMNTTGAMSHMPGASVEEGPSVEVVVDRDTVILADVTALSFDWSSITEALQGDNVSELASADRVIEPGVLEDVEPNTMIWIWGERTGDRINATVVLYMVLPFSMGS
jgi:hypothetical protein